MARCKDIYKPLRRKHGEGTGKFCTVNLKEEVAKEFKLLVNAYSIKYGQKMTPTQVIKRLMDAGVKRCDSDVFGTFQLLKKLESESSFYNDNLMELHCDNPDLFFNHEVDPTKGDVWDMLYLAEKSGEVVELQMDKDHQFCGEINGVQT